MVILTDPKIYFNGESKYNYEYQAGYLEKIAIDYSKRKIRGTVKCRYTGEEKWHKSVEWFNFEDERIRVVYE